MGALLAPVLGDAVDRVFSAGAGFNLEPEDDPEGGVWSSEPGSVGCPWVLEVPELISTSLPLFYSPVRTKIWLASCLRRVRL
jgi:hypothetical protein